MISTDPEPNRPTAAVETATGATTRPETLRRAALRGSVATVIGRFVINATRLGSNLVLTRLLLPEHFGVIAIVNVTMTGLQMFSDLGIGTAIIQNERGDEPRFLRTAFTLQAVRGIGLMLAGCAIGWPLAQIYDNMPELAWMIPVASFTALVDGFTSTKVMRANRNLQFVPVLIIELANTLAAAAAMIALAYVTRSVTALLFGGIAGSITRVALSHLWLRGERDRFGWDAEARRSLLGFSRWILLSTATTFIAMQIDRLTLGRLVDVDMLGIYSTAITLAAVPREVLGQLVERVLYPVVAKLLREGADGATIRRLRQRILLLVAPLIAVLVGLADALFRLLYSGPFETGAPLLPVLCFGAWLNVLNCTYGVVMLARGWPRFITYGTGLKAAIFALAVLPVHGAFGIHGVAALTSLSEAAVIAAVAAGCRSMKVTTIAFDLLATVAIVAVALAVHAAQAELTRATGTPLLGMALFGAVALAVAGYGARRLGVLRREGAEPSAPN